MESITVNSSFLWILFLGIAILYSSVGLGGGSAYTALLAIFGVTYTAIPGISLTLNLVVTTMGSFNFLRKGHAHLQLIFPFVITSIPMSYLGGRLHLTSQIFYLLLLASLIVVVLRIYAMPKKIRSIKFSSNSQLIMSLGIGALLGFIAGAVGIGGGVYLVPLIILLGFGTEKEAAASGAIFILVNSLAGILGRYNAGNYHILEILPLAGMVLIGGFLGSWLGSGHLKPDVMRKVLSVALVIAIIMLTRKMLMS